MYESPRLQVFLVLQTIKFNKLSSTRTHIFYQTLNSILGQYYPHRNFKTYISTLTTILLFGLLGRPRIRFPTRFSTKNVVSTHLLTQAIYTSSLPIISVLHTVLQT